MHDAVNQSGHVGTVVASEKEFDEFVVEAMPQLLDRATALTKRFLRETGQWAEDIGHDKFAVRWGYEMVERFIICARVEVPCRPFLLLESFVTRYYSQPDALYYHKDQTHPLGRYLDALLSRAVLSRDALMALFHHLYGFNQTSVAKLLGINREESQRVYKNFERWRESGWQRVMEDTGVSDEDLDQLEQDQRRFPERVNHETDRILRTLQIHYRKSDPARYPCLTRAQWESLFREDYGFDYRTWHLPFCHDCCVLVCAIREEELQLDDKLQIDLHVRPLVKGRTLALVGTARGGNHHHDT